ncbi:MAG: MBL fold metallo-hydrolase [Pseudomonadota bacterium]
MQLLDRRTLLATTAATAGLTGFAGRATGATAGADVFTSDSQGGDVDSVVVLGDEKALLIDAQFTKSNATALADMIEATGRELETIFISHYHPDHVLGLAVLMDRFPTAKPVAHGAVQPLVAKSAQGMLEAMAAGRPGVFADRAVIPEALPGDTLSLEGERFDIIGPLHGDTGLVAGVHIPQLDTVVASDLVYADTHVWVAENTTAEDLAKWRASLDQIEAIGAGAIIPGHRLFDTANDATTFAHTRAYLDQWERALTETSSAEELRAAMMAGNEGLGLVFAVDRAVAAVYPG